MADPIVEREGRVTWLDLVDLQGNLITVDRALRMIGRAFFMEPNRPKIAIVMGQIIAPYSKYIDKNGEVKEIDQNIEFTEVLDNIGYPYKDLVAADMRNPDKRIQMFYADEDIDMTNIKNREYIKQTEIVSIEGILYPGAYEIISKLRTVFDGRVDFSDPYIKEQLDKTYTSFVQPTTLRYTSERSRLCSAQGSYEALQKFMEWYYKLQYHNMEEYQSDKDDAIEELVLRLFEEKFRDKFETTKSDPNKGESFIEGLFVESIQYVALMSFLDALGGGSQTDGRELAQNVEEFFLNNDEKQIEKMINEFIKKSMPIILLRFAESFFTGTQTITMRFDYNPSTQIGWEHETMSFIFIESYFLIKEFINNDYNDENLKFFEAMIYNPKNIRATFKDDYQKILDADLGAVKSAIHNNFDLFDNNRNYRLGDLVSVLIPDYGFVSFECKNSPDPNSDYLLNVVIDEFSKIQAALDRSVSTGDVNIEVQKEHMIVATDPKDRGAISRLIRKLTQIRKPKDLSYGEGLGEGIRKGPKHMEFYSRIVDLLNAHGGFSSTDVSQAKANIVDLFRTDKIFIEEVKEIAVEVFSIKTKIDEKTKHYLVEATNNFINIDKRLFVKDASGFLKIELDLNYNVYKNTGIVLTTDHLKNIEFFAVKREKFEILSLSKLTPNEIKGSWAVVHRKHEGKYQNGLLLVNNPEMELSTLEGVYDGYRDPVSGRVIEGIFISRYDKTTKKSNLLIGNVRLNPKTKLLETVHSEHIAALLDKSVIPIPIETGWLKSLGIEKYYSFTYVRSACQKVGSKVSYVIQKVNSRIIPTGPHKRLISGPKVAKSFSSRVKSYKIPTIHPIDKKELFNGFIDIFDFKFLSKEESSSSTLHSVAAPHFSNILGGLNTKLILTKNGFEYVEDSKRDQNQIENVINKLFDIKEVNSKEDLHKLFFNNLDGTPVRADEYSLKEWLEHFRRVINRWNDPGEGNRDEFEELIAKIKPKMDNIISFNTNEKLFSEEKISGASSELTQAITVLECASRLLGQKTLFLMFMRGFKLYESKGVIKMQPMSLIASIVVKYVQEYNIIHGAQEQRKDKYFPSGDSHMFIRNAYSYIFGNSYMYLPIRGENTKSNSFYFGYSAMPFMPSQILHQVYGGVLTNPQQLIGRKIQNQFKEEYDDYLSQLNIRRGAQTKVRLFKQSCSEMIGVIKEKVTRHFLTKAEAGEITFEKAHQEINNIILTTHLELINSYSNQVTENALMKGVKKPSIRFQIEDLINGNDDTITISFYSSVVDGKIFRLPFNKEDFFGKQIYIFGQISAEYKEYFNKEFVEEVNNQFISKRVEILKDIIEAQPEKKVRIFITQSPGVKIENNQLIEFGYQYLFPYAGKQKRLYLPRTTTGGSNPSFIDVNFEGKLGVDYDWEMTKLNYIALLSISLESTSRVGAGTDGIRMVNPQDFLFIMKKADSSFQHESAICMFNYRKISQFESIHSPKKFPNQDYTMKFEQVFINAAEEGAIFNNDWKIDWESEQIFIAIWITSKGIEIKDFDKYHDFIDYYKNRELNQQ